MNDEIIAKLSKIKVLVMDIDGTLTDAKVYYSKNGEELKRFSIRDGMGIDLLRMNGVIPAFMTSENSPIVTARAAKLKIEHVELGARQKGVRIRELVQKLGVELSETAFLGDDVNDLPAMRLSGFTACPSDASPRVREFVDYVCSAKAGDGAARELAEMILTSKNIPIEIPENW